MANLLIYLIIRERYKLVNNLVGLSEFDKLKRLISVPSTTPPGDVSGIVELIYDFGV